MTRFAAAVTRSRESGVIVCLIAVSVLVFVAVWAGPRTAAGGEVEATLTTTALGFAEARSGESVSVTPVAAVLSLRAYQLDIPGYDVSSIVAQGWARAQLGDDALHDSSGDLGLLYVEGYNAFLSTRIGRQHIAGVGGILPIIDGVDARVDVGAGLSLEGFGGLSSRPGFDWDRGDWLTGGRLSAQFSVPAEIGLHYVHQRTGGAVSRETLGVDGYTLVGPVRLIGFAAVTPRYFELLEARLAVAVRPSEVWRLTVDAQRVVPGVVLSRNSIFSVFSDAPYDTGGAAAQWVPSENFRLDAAWHALLADAEWLGYRTRIAVTTHRDPSHRSAAGAEVSRVVEDQNGYSRGRVFTSLRLHTQLRVVADAYVAWFDETVNGSRLSLVANTSLVYDLGSAIRLAASIDAGTTPYARSHVGGLVQFEYGYSTSTFRDGEP